MMAIDDIWHYPRTDLAQQIVGMFEIGLSNALVFFAPRRMGKTEFLLKDITPLAEKNNWLVFYFSFLETTIHSRSEFTRALLLFAEQSKKYKSTKALFSRMTKISGEMGGIGGSIEFDADSHILDIKEIFKTLTKKQKLLLLMDEIQSLASDKSNTQFVSSLRTALDMYKDDVKVIFTGSSQEGLRCMFSQAKAPFFHFGQNLPFPGFDQQFTHHLARVFQLATGREIDKEALWKVFNELQCIPQLARSLVERMVLYPNLALIEAKEGLLLEVYNARAYVEIWAKCSAFEKLLLCVISEDGTLLFSEKTRGDLANRLGIPELSLPTMQSTLRVLQRKSLIGRFPERGSGYFIEDPNLKSWIRDQL